MATSHLTQVAVIVKTPPIVPCHLVPLLFHVPRFHLVGRQGMVLYTAPRYLPLFAHCAHSLACGTVRDGPSYRGRGPHGRRPECVRVPRPECSQWRPYVYTGLDVCGLGGAFLCKQLEDPDVPLV